MLLFMKQRLSKNGANILCSLHSAGIETAEKTTGEE
jgi:hypothetical protein